MEKDHEKELWDAISASMKLRTELIVRLSRAWLGRDFSPATECGIADLLRSDLRSLAKAGDALKQLRGTAAHRSD